MTAKELTPEQKIFANLDSEAFVEACPGAGKTHTVVARLRKIAETLPPRRGEMDPVRWTTLGRN